MKNNISHFDEYEALHKLKHYLPAQASLKDFIHHNTLHGFQNLKFYKGIIYASELFGSNVSLSIEEYRKLYKSSRIKDDILEKVIEERLGAEYVNEWKEKVLNKEFNHVASARIGKLRHNWKEQYHINLDSLVHPILFRTLCSYLDQGISIWNFPVHNKGFLSSIREIERNSYTSFFKSKRVKELLNNHCQMSELLKILVGDESLYENYIFDQQFAHPGWSGIVSAIEDNPKTLLDARKITVHELVMLELLMEIDAMDTKFNENWSPLSYKLKKQPPYLFRDVEKTEYHEAITILQDAFEWSYYDEVLAGIKNQKQIKKTNSLKSFQAMFCIDDRECSMRRNLEHIDSTCETFGTPGFFNAEFYYQPEHGKFYDKLCPAPLNPKYLIKELESTEKRETEFHHSKRTHSLFTGWIITHTVGFWSAFKLFYNIFRPTMSPATASSFKHMDQFSQLTIENKSLEDTENNLQIGFTLTEMADRVEGLLRSIGLVDNFAKIIYAIGHGSSSVNNPHYAAYDCGACSGRPGSVNARVICHMANHPEVRKILSSRGLHIPDETQFIGGLHDTTRDDITFFDKKTLSDTNMDNHIRNKFVFKRALDLNSRERSRRFESINTKLSLEEIHNRTRRRSVSLFEPRPELNHATNALCIVGPRNLSDHLFLDRRSFLNSYNYKTDLEGKYLLNILKAVAPVCGGINLEYYFSRVDNEVFGAGTKLPHNVMGLFGVANGTDGDLRPGLPSQMIEVHDPVRLLVIVEHFPEVVLDTIKKDLATYEWFINEWIHLVVVHPDTHLFFLLKNGKFSEYKLLKQDSESVSDYLSLLSSDLENLPVTLIEEQI